MSETPIFPTSDHMHMRRQRGQRFTLNCHTFLRFVLPATVIAAFLLFIFTSSILDQTSRRAPWKKPAVVFPDFSHYKFIQTLPHSHFPIHPDDGKRIVAVGDLHAMNQSLSALLDKISYDPQSDTLIHLGDLVSKSKNVSSEPILAFMSTNRILGVRGNNDQKVIERRAWMNWIESLPGGREWLEDLWSDVDGDQFDASFKKSHKEWKEYVPSGWKLQGKHCKLAREMSQEHLDYLSSLPLVIHAPTAHTFFVHAGLLPADPMRALDDPSQPLSHFPTTGNPEEDARRLQELALLNEVPQNQDPWVLMNMRSLSEDGKVIDGKKGTPWSDIWSEVMGGCAGSPSVIRPEQHPTTSCFPSMVLYGHAAVRDLDVKRWSVGLDTGCAYGRRLTAVLLDANSLFPQTHIGQYASPHDSIIQYGDDGIARVVSVACA